MWYTLPWVFDEFFHESIPERWVTKIHVFHHLPNYMLLNWPVVFDSLSWLLQLTSLRVFLYDLLKTIDDHSCQPIAKAASLFSDFIFCFRHTDASSDDDEFLIMAFGDHQKFIKQLCHYILLLTGEKSPYYSIESDGYGLRI